MTLNLKKPKRKRKYIHVDTKKDVMGKLIGTRYGKVPKRWEQDPAMLQWRAGDETITHKELALFRSERTCERCGVLDEEQRYFYVACFYGMEELNPMWHRRRWEDGEPGRRAEYYVHTCKSCRADLLKALNAVLMSMPEPD